MSRYFEPTPEQCSGWAEWVRQRPDHVRVIAERFNPWTLYRLGTTGNRVIVRAFDESDNGVKVRVQVLGRFNLVIFEREVFGIDPGDLSECELPDADEVTGALFQLGDD